jgi:hypothetical protein
MGTLSRFFQISSLAALIVGTQAIVLSAPVVAQPAISCSGLLNQPMAIPTSAVTSRLAFSACNFTPPDTGGPSHDGSDAAGTR